MTHTVQTAGTVAVGSGALLGSIGWTIMGVALVITLAWAAFVLVVTFPTVWLSNRSKSADAPNTKTSRKEECHSTKKESQSIPSDKTSDGIVPAHPQPKRSQQEQPSHQT